MSINIFSVPGLIAWLEGQDPETEYEYTLSSDCLITRYMLAQGVDVPGMPTCGVKISEIEKWGFYDISNHSPYTYGAALARAKEMV